MCGIAGFLLKDFQDNYREKAHSLVRVLHHRGPDGNGVWNDESMVLVHNRLAIIDLSEAGAQPMISRDGNFIITFNGEIYNYKELQNKYLPEMNFKGHSDTEVLLELLSKKGTSILPELNGMFAFALWNKKKKELLLVRDQIGIKPLYYFLKDGKFIFASEIKAIVDVLGYTPAIEMEALENYFTFCHAIAPRTIFKNIFKLPHAHYAILTYPCSFEIKQYWNVSSLPSTDGGTMGMEELDNEVDRLVNTAVKRQLVADVDVGVFLSGGIDSSAIVSYATQNYSKKLKTFSVGFEYQTFNELSDARMIADMFGTDHHEISLTDIDLIPIIEKLVYHYDEPFGDAASFPTYLLSEFARRHVKVALSGEGGDEIFGGYNRYISELMTDQIRKIPGFIFAARLIRPLISSLPRTRRIKKIFDTISIKEPYLRYGSLISFFDERQLALLLKRPLLHSPCREAYEDLWRKYTAAHLGQDDILNWMLYADQNRWMVETYLEKLDKASMAVSLETRVPLLDIELVKFMSNVPGSMKVDGRRKKALFRRVLRNKLPERILDKSKHGFSVPTDKWFRGKLFSFVTEIIDSSENDLGQLLDFNFIKKMVQDHKIGRKCYDSQIWLILIFCLWYQRFKPSGM